MSSTVEQHRRQAASLTVMPYVLLGALTAFTAYENRHHTPRLTLDLALSVAAAGWMLCMVTIRPAFRERPALMGVFVAGLVGVTGFLVVHDPWFGCFAPALYVFSFRLLPWPWTLPAVAAVSVVSGTAQSYGIDKGTAAGIGEYLAVVVANVVPLCWFAWFAHTSGVRNEQRVAALSEAAEANRRLAVSLAENAELHERLVVQAREAGVLDERRRMAREIHDTLAQGLTGIIAQLQAAEQARRSDDDWRRHVGLAVGLARESLNEARRSVHELRPGPLDAAPDVARLDQALQTVTARWSERQDAALQFAVTGTPRPLPPDAEVVLLRIAQEALANVARHSGATRVGVTLSYLEDDVAVDVIDDGCGFHPDEPRPERTDGGFGLVAMRQRIEALAGTLHIESSPGSGTGVSAVLPARTARPGEQPDQPRVEARP